MKREIKFRGLDFNDVWVYGYVIINKDGDTFIKNTDYNVNNGRIDIIPINVIPGTVGQFTGLYDKNGLEIYEGDILTANEYPYQDEGKYNYHAVVEWIYYSWQTVLRCVNPKKIGISDGINETMEFEAGETTDYEIIGNIHEHKHLIE